jgi:tetratricopeptide (TPR) repeat protein
MSHPGASGQAAILFQQANGLHRAGRLDEAERVYRQVAALAPASPEPWHHLGAVLQQAGRAGQAVEAITRAAKLAPHSADILLSLGTAQRGAGHIDAAIDSFRRALRLRPGFAEGHYNLGNTYLKAGRAEDAVRAYARALAIRPGFVEAANNQGNALLALGRPAEALACFEMVAAAAPGQAEAQVNLANALQALGRLDEADAALHRATGAAPDQVAFWRRRADLSVARRDAASLLACRRQVARLAPDDPGAQHDLGESLIEAEPESAVVCLRRALALDPAHLDAALKLAGTLVTLARPQEADDMLRGFPAQGDGEAPILAARATALRSMMQIEATGAVLRRALLLQPDHKAALVSQAMHLLMQGDYAGGFALYEHRFAAGLPQPELSTPRWHGESLAGRTLLVHAEQGLGDTLQFCRFVPGLASTVAAAGGRLVLAVQPPTVRLLRSLDADCAVVADDAALPAHDVHLMMMSLPSVLGTTITTLPQPPYLRADPVQAARWQARLAGLPGPRVGLVWAGNAAYSYDRTRSLRLAALSPLLEVAGVSLVSLQKQPPAGDLPMPPRITDWTGEFDDFADTAALVAGLDLVIAADSSVAHVAGALGRPVWLLNRFNTEWRWLPGRQDSPWYPRHRIFHQPAPGDWDSVVQTVTDALTRLPKPQA